jgi:hypothetical protein
VGAREWLRVGQIDVIERIRQYQAPIVFTCTGSCDAPGPILEKPYTLEKLIALMESRVLVFLGDGCVHLEGSSLRRNDSLIMYETAT